MKSSFRQNPKSEYRNPKQIQNSNFKTTKQPFGRFARNLSAASFQHCPFKRRLSPVFSERGSIIHTWQEFVRKMNGKPDRIDGFPFLNFAET
jgi:hypothetical protein